jgi:[NiFe] hydrogenase diaphorase moiety small subunit
MSKPKTPIHFTIDGKKCEAVSGQTILQASKDNGVYIPALCRWEAFRPAGACRVCTVRVGGRYMAACTQPVAEGMAVENNVPDLQDMRKALIEMLFVEGNHMCPTCEKSGNCELQALAYRFQMLVPRFPYEFPARKVEPAGKKILLEHNRCIKCLRCVRGVRTRDNKAVFGALKRSLDKEITVDQALASALSEKQARQAMDRCPVGSILKKEVGFVVPIGKRKFDKVPIGSDVEKAKG